MSGTQADAFEREDFGDVTVVRVQVPLLRSDEVTDALFQQTDALLDGAGRSRLVLNFDRVVFLASVGIGHLVRLVHHARKVGGRLVLCKVLPAIHEVLQKTYLTDLLPVYGDEQEAVQSFR
jgi:anti-anti-sigma factor